MDSKEDHHPAHTATDGGRTSHDPSAIDHEEAAAINRQITQRLQNPLHGISKEQLFADVEKFAVEKRLEDHVEILKKGALVAQNHDLEMIEELSPEERDIIHYERAHRWSHPKTLYITIFLCSLGAATQGWDQTGSNGANLSFPKEFGIGREDPEPGFQHDEWLVGLVNAAPYFASALVGCWLSDPLNNYFGRRGTIFITALILIITPICSGLTQTWQQLFAVRILLGVGMGCKGSTVPVFAAENSPAAIRGALVMGWQCWTAFGIFLGFCANAAVGDVGRIAWRLQLGSAFIPALPLAIGIFFCPESPRWLMKKDRYAQAWKSLIRLRHSELQAARDLYYIHVQLMEERKIIRGDNYFTRAMELFTIPRVKRATLAAGVVMLAQQMCGINIIAFYSSTVFVRGGSTPRQALYASLGFGAINFLFAFPAFWTIDRLGRRFLLLATFPLMAITLLAAGLCFLIPDESVGKAGPNKIGAVALFIYLFAMAYSPGEGPVPFTYSAEVFPLAQREQGMSFAVATCLGWAGVLTITFPRMLRAMTPTGAFAFYAGLNLIALCLIFLFVPETKQFTLEELDSVFSIRTKDHIAYQTKKAVPYFVRRYIKRDKTAHLEPLIAEPDAWDDDDVKGKPITALHGNGEGKRFDDAEKGKGEERRIERREGFAE